jgi:outer membrane lipoprotein-sorting protein
MRVTIVGGLVLSIIIGIGMAAKSNPRIMRKLIELLEAISTISASVIKIILK